MPASAPALSIIIPVYNAENFLGDTLARVAAQSLADIEVILVDDASTDASASVIADFCRRDPRFRSHTLTANRGPGFARNCGMDLARGEFLAFLDADDSPGDAFFYERLWREAKWSGADIAKGEYFYPDQGAASEEFNSLILKDRHYFSMNFCAAIFRRDLLAANNLRFPPLRDMEDPVFAFSAARAANRVAISPSAFLRIGQRKDSLTRESQRKLRPEVVHEKIKGILLLIDELNQTKDLDIDCYLYTFEFWVYGFIAYMANFSGARAESLLQEGIRAFFSQASHASELREEFTGTLPGLLDPERDIWFCQHDLEELKLRIASADVISFDVFDTLILRPFFQPTDVFKFLGRIYGEPKFAEMRKEAEAAARRARVLRRHAAKALGRDMGEEVSLPEIYRQLPPQMLAFMERELEFEKRIAAANAEMAAILAHARKLGKKIVITSDMYLSGKDMRELLAGAGITDYDALFVSSETGKSKHSGAMWEHVLKALGVAPERLLHVGDNMRADVESPAKFGIESFYYPALGPRYRRSLNVRLGRDRRMPGLIRNFSNIAMTKWSKSRPFYYQLGLLYGAPLALAFCTQIRRVRQARKLEALFFVMRDGYAIKRVYDILYGGQKTFLLYANRGMRGRYLDDPAPEDEADYSEYVSRFGKPESYGVVDTVTGTFTGQKLLKRYLGGQSTGVYITTHGFEPELDYFNLSNYPQLMLIKYFGWTLVESFLSAPVPPILAVRGGQPVYAVPRPEETQRLKDYRHVLAGVLAGCRAYKKYFGVPDDLPIMDTLAWLHELVAQPTPQEREHLAKWLFAGSEKHDEYKSQLNWLPERLADILDHNSLVNSSSDN